MVQTRDPLLRAALAEWRRVAPRAGLEPEAYSPEPLSRRHVGQSARIVLRLRAADRPDLVFKRVFRPVEPARWADGLAAQRAARAVLSPASRPARVIHAETDRQAAILAWVPGQSLHDHLMAKFDQGAQRAGVLRRAGAWLAEFHRVTGSGEVAFHAGTLGAQLARMQARAENDPASMVDADLFLVLAGALGPHRDAAQGARIPCAALHGDLHSGNIVLGAKTATALDFCSTGVGPVLPEVAQLLADIAARFTPVAGAGPLGLRPVDLAAFEAGYGRALGGDPALAYLVRAHLLRKWARLGPLDEARSDFTAERIGRIQGHLQRMMRPSGARVASAG